MSIQRDGRTLPWTFLRRQVRPYALAVSLACAVIVEQLPEEQQPTPEQIAAAEAAVAGG